MWTDASLRDLVLEPLYVDQSDHGTGWRAILAAHDHGKIFLDVDQRGAIEYLHAVCESSDFVLLYLLGEEPRDACSQGRACIVHEDDERRRRVRLPLRVLHLVRAGVRRDVRILFNFSFFNSFY